MPDISKELSPPGPHASSAFLRVSRMQPIPGYLPGMHQSAVVAEFRMLADAPAAAVLATFMRSAEETCGALPELKAFSEFERWPVLACVARVTVGLLQRAGWPVFDAVTVFQKRTTAERVLLAFPSVQLSDKGVVFALQAAVELLYAVAAGRAPDPAKLPATLKQLQGHAPRGMNSLRFLEAAHAQQIPWKRLAGNIYQFGWGARARWLDSSFTDQTPSLSVGLARDKRAAAEVLRQAGVPVPAHARAANAAEALRIAERLGYPVVVKPADLDAGKGVTAWLETPAEVTEAFAAAAALSKSVLVEKHFIGNDYRLQVFNGDVFWATRRVPAGVTGDGVHSVRALVELANADPRRGAPGSARLKWLVLDTEGIRWLTRQGLDAEAVPAAGRIVRLRGAANVASGGTIEPVLDIAHPDNLALAARAAALLRLDVAGVDLLIPDIRRPWHESGAVICEVNAQPQMAAHLPAELLKRLVAQQGRIPVLLVLGGEREGAVCTALFDALGKTWPGCGLASRHGVRISGRQVAIPPLTSLHAGNCVLNDPAATLLALHVDDEDLLQSGCPADSVDYLVLAGPLQKNGKPDWQGTLSLATWLAHISKQVWLLDAAPQWQQAPLASQRADVPALLAHVTRTLAETR